MNMRASIYIISLWEGDKLLRLIRLYLDKVIVLRNVVLLIATLRWITRVDVDSLLGYLDSLVGLGSFDSNLLLYTLP